MDIYRRLRQDHAWQRELANLVLETAADDPDRSKLYNRFSNELKTHITAEEQSLYGIVLCLPPCHLMARRGIYGHQQILDCMRNLDKVPFDSDDWQPSFVRLRNDFEHYTCDEEEFLFPEARKCLEYATGVRLARVYAELMSSCMSKRPVGLRTPLDPIHLHREKWA